MLACLPVLEEAGAAVQVPAAGRGEAQHRVAAEQTPQRATVSSVRAPYSTHGWCGVSLAHSTKNRLPVLPGMELSYSPIGVVDGCCPSWNSTAIV